MLHVSSVPIFELGHRGHHDTAEYIERNTRQCVYCGPQNCSTICRAKSIDFFCKRYTTTIYKGSISGQKMFRLKMCMSVLLWTCCIPCIEILHNPFIMFIKRKFCVWRLEQLFFHGPVILCAWTFFKVWNIRDFT